MRRRDAWALCSMRQQQRYGPPVASKSSNACQSWQGRGNQLINDPRSGRVSNAAAHTLIHMLKFVAQPRLGASKEKATNEIRSKQSERRSEFVLRKTRKDVAGNGIIARWRAPCLSLLPCGATRSANGAEQVGAVGAPRVCIDESHDSRYEKREPTGAKATSALAKRNTPGGNRGWHG